MIINKSMINRKIKRGQETDSTMSPKEDIHVMTTNNSIPEEWIKNYVDSLLQAASTLEIGKMRDAVLLRADNIIDLVKAYRSSSKDK